MRSEDICAVNARDAIHLTGIHLIVKLTDIFDSTTGDPGPLPGSFRVREVLYFLLVGDILAVFIREYQKKTERNTAVTHVLHCFLCRDVE